MNRDGRRSVVAAWVMAMMAFAAVPMAAAATTSSPGGPALTALTFHPNDGVDPLGFAWQGSDPFTLRHAGLAAQAGRFDYPFFVADGLTPVVAVPQPSQPYASVLAAYTQAVEQRQALEAPVRLHLWSEWTPDGLMIRLAPQVKTDLSGEDLHVWMAVAEDPVHYQPPPSLTNGIVDHRFTVRAIEDAGTLYKPPPGDSAPGTKWAPFDQAQWLVPTGDWDPDNLVVAAWVEQASASSRFDAHEVVQATHAAAGQSVQQDGKGVLVEMLSATWCDPCLYGDLALQDLAVRLGAAAPLQPASTSYVEWPSHPWLVLALAAAFGVAVAAPRPRGGAP